MQNESEGDGFFWALDHILSYDSRKNREVGKNLEI